MRKKKAKQAKREESLSVSDYLHELAIYGLTYCVELGRVKLEGEDVQILERCNGILSKRPDLEVRLILHEAVRNADLLDEIKERASIRWTEGYSDSLYSAVMCNIKPVEETRSYNDTPDEKQAAFLRRMGFAEADITNQEKSPSVWRKLKPQTDWDAELEKYR